MNLLALDIASITGYCSNNGSGTWDFRPKRNESKGMRIIKFKAQLKRIILAEEINLISYELPAGQHKNAIIVASEMIGVMKLLCEQYAINYLPYPPKKIKSYATGNGNASKAMMVEEAKRYFKIDIIDDNHADALFLYDLTKTDLLC